MKKNVTYVCASKFESLIAASGLAAKAQAGFVKVSGPTGRHLYVARTKRVGRVDLSGFEVTDLAVINLGDSSFCSVTQQLDFSQNEETILATFEQLLTIMAALEPVEPKTRKAKSKKEDDVTGWSPAFTTSKPEVVATADKA